MRGITFGDVHSYNDLNLILTKSEVPPALPKTNFVEIPAGDGSADLTEALGEVRYNDREALFTFTVLPSDDFEEKKRQVNQLVNGRRLPIVEDVDPDYTWYGRCAVNEYASNKNIHQIVIGATLAPYKLKIPVTVTHNGTGDVLITNSGRKTVVPYIECSTDTVLQFEGNTYNLSAGVHKVLDIGLITGEHTVTIVSGGTTKFNYQEGDL